MPPEGLRTNSGDASVSTSMTAQWANTQKALQAWSRTCDVYSKYFTSLAHSQNPQAVLAANMEFMSGGMQIISSNAIGLTKADTPIN